MLQFYFPFYKLLLFRELEHLNLRFVSYFGFRALDFGFRALDFFFLIFLLEIYISLRMQVPCQFLLAIGLGVHHIVFLKRL